MAWCRNVLLVLGLMGSFGAVADGVGYVGLDSELQAEQGQSHGDAPTDQMGFVRHDVSMDDPNAFQIFTQRAEQGDPVAETNLGVMYQTARGVAENDVLAAQWFRKAAEQDFALG